MDPTGLNPEGEGPSNAETKRPSRAAGDVTLPCDYIVNGTECVRVVGPGADNGPDDPDGRLSTSGGGGPGGGYWRSGDGSDIGMRGWNQVMQEGLFLKAKHQFEEELAFQRAIGRTRTANGVCTLPGDEATKQGLPAQALVNTLDTLAPFIATTVGGNYGFAALIVIAVIDDAVDDGSAEDVSVTLDEIKSGDVEISSDRGISKLQGTSPRPGQKQRNKPPAPAPKAQGRPHTVVERTGPDGQYTTHNGDGSWKQFRGSGRDHGNIPRPNVKETMINVTPDGQRFPGKPWVRPARADEVPGG